MAQTWFEPINFFSEATAKAQGLLVEQMDEIRSFQHDAHVFGGSRAGIFYTEIDLGVWPKTGSNMAQNIRKI